MSDEVAYLIQHVDASDFSAAALDASQQGPLMILHVSLRRPCRSQNAPFLVAASTKNGRRNLHATPHTMTIHTEKRQIHDRP